MFESASRGRGLQGLTLFAISFVVLLSTAIFAASASATVPSVFTGMSSPAVTCTVQTGATTAGQRWCSASPSRVATWDSTPIDVTVALPPAPASGPDGNFPIVGVYHGWGGSKALPASANIQHLLLKGYAVFSMSDRGWAQSCGTPATRSGLPAWATCAHGYIHLDDQAYEERDAQYLLGQLADEGVIDPQRTAASGASYGGILSVQLAALNNRTRLPDGSLVPWVSPNLGIPMRTVAAVPQALASDISYALIPNGSMLDYVAKAPYFGPLGNLRVGIQKATVLNGFYGNSPTPTTKYYAPVGSDPSADIVDWHDWTTPPGPFDGPNPTSVINEMTSMHSAFYVDDSVAPAPMLLTSGLWDDFVPADESIRYYNKVRADHPETPIAMLFGDLGHARSDDKAGDIAEANARQDAWLGYYVKGEGAVPTQGVETFGMTCPGTAADEGPYFFSSYAAMESGEVRVVGGSTQTIQATGTQFGTQLSTPTATSCTKVDGTDNPSTANYRSPAATGSGYTIAGSATVTAKFTVSGASDQIAARLLDVGPDGQEQLVERGLYRPLMDGGAGTQVFQMHPNVFHVAAGHVLKLELLPDDYPYSIRNSASPDSAAQHPIQVSNLELRVPSMDAPGSAEGLVQTPLAKFLPAGYTLARNVAPGAPTAPQLTGGSNPNGDGVLSLSWAPTQSAPAPSYTLEHKSASGNWSVVAAGLSSPEYAFTAGSPEAEGTWTYRVSESNESSASEPSAASEAVKVDESAPNAPSANPDRAPDYAGGGGWYKDTVTVSFTDNGDPLLSDGSSGSGVDLGTISAPQTFNTDGAHEASGTVADNVGNVSAAGTASVQVDASAPNVEVSCPANAQVGQSGVNATVTASDAQSGLSQDPSGTVPIDTSKSGSQTVTRTAIDNVGHESSDSCTTLVGYTKVITGKVPFKLVVKNGESVQLTSTAQAKQIEVQPGGALDIEGASSKGIKANGAVSLRICGASISGALTVSGSTGPVVIGEETEACASSTISNGASLKGNTGGVSIRGNTFQANLKVTNGSGGTTVIHNTVKKTLTVTGNSGSVTDTPNTVGGKTKVQARRG